MRQLIEDLLAYSRTNIAERKFEKIDLNTIIEEVKAELKENIEEKHAIIEASEMCEMAVIPFQFRQLMHNLIRNSRKFSSPKRVPRIQITSKIVKGNKLNNAKLVGAKTYCHISVSDNGIGFEPQYKDRIFEVFQKLHNREKYEGTGIGLAIVKKIVENHNGIVTATSQPNKGATFDIFLPLTEN
jgi:signal transduction histidine kinase